MASIEQEEEQDIGEYPFYLSSHILTGVIDSESGFSSPTWSPSDIIESLGDVQKGPEYLVERANDLITLLQQHPKFKFDIAMHQLGEM